MRKIIKSLKVLDIAVIVVLLIKVSAFYLATDMTGIRFLNAILTFMFFLLIGLMFSLSYKKGTTVIFGILYTLISILMFADSMYFSYFNQLPSILQLAQVNSMIVVDSDTFAVTLPPINLLLVIDIPFIIWYFTKLNKRIGKARFNHYHRILQYSFFGLTFLILIGVLNPLNVDALKIMNKSELVTYHLRDIYDNVIATDGEYISSQEDLDELFADIGKRNTEIQDEYISLDGIAKDMNIIIIQVESLQNFPINQSFNGVELTPNLNRLLQDETIYFENYYQTIGRGNTSDAEFTSTNGVYPVLDGESYRLYEQNTYNGLPWLLKEKGYTSTVYHGFEGDFWNRESAYVNLGFDDFISLEDMEMTEKIAFGLSDKAMFEQAADHIEAQYIETGKPFHSVIITLSCHYPYRMPEEFRLNVEEDDDRYDSLMLNYLGGVRYSDYAIGLFLEDLKEKGLDENTMIVMYGDHHGLNAKDKDNFELMSEFLGKPYDYDEMLNIPMLIHIPGIDNTPVEDTVIEKVGGQVDLLPTIAYLMDLQVDELVMGQNLFTKEEGFVASVTYMLKGSFVKDGVIYEASSTEVFEEGRAWSLDTNEEIEDFDYLFDDFVNACRLVEGSEYLLENNLIEK